MWSIWFWWVFGQVTTCQTGKTTGLSNSLMGCICRYSLYLKWICSLTHFAPQRRLAVLFRCAWRDMNEATSSHCFDANCLFLSDKCFYSLINITQYFTCWVLFFLATINFLLKSGLNCILAQQVRHKHPKMTLSSECLALNSMHFFWVGGLHCTSIFRLPVVVSPKQRHQFFAGTTPPPPSTCNKYFPCGLSPVNTIK